MQATSYDMVVVGAGHAGCEAALAGSRLGARVLVVTLRKDRIAHMSCNPAVGGVGKGQLVREIDALGGGMGQVADATGIQFRRLNLSRGPAVQSTRCQSDAEAYRKAMTAMLLSAPGVRVVGGEVAEVIAGRGLVKGVVLAGGEEVGSRAVVVTAGTFLRGLCHVGEEQFVGGRHGDRDARLLSGSLESLGVELGRFKTGTVPRLRAETIAWEGLERQEGDRPAPRFGFEGGLGSDGGLPQVACFISRTNPGTHEVVRGELGRSPLYQGVIKGMGPRYCPSFEDKVVRFPERSHHHVFLEPEGLNSERVYPNGLSTSLPKDVQERFVRTIKGLERAEIVQYGYAVEYDYALPGQLGHDLMSKKVGGLFLAGQVNGTSGYEEAAAQGLIAGLNAVRYLGGQDAAVLGRDEAYVGVLIDDLVVKGVDEPYRMFTSRAEHRLLLRESNAEERLWRKGVRWGVLSGARAERAEARQEERDALRAMVRRGSAGVVVSGQGRLEEAVRRPEVRLGELVGEGFSREAIAVVEEEIKYGGYIVRQRKAVERDRELEGVRLPEDLVYAETPGLSRELCEKLERVRPRTLGQASRIRGMTPAGVAVLRLEAYRRGRRAGKVAGR